MELNKTIHGFTVKRIRPIDELDAEFIEMTHNKTGAELAWIKRSEENKTFGIAFETLPFDDTGVFHILEHSVLCGSQKYQVKEPFVELLKTSMNTFLNAMTFPDKTFYPISSRNEKDFYNLLRVYLDAVFCPMIYTKPEIFAQEGWHYEFDENDNVSYKGVVFNEMKGVFASADELEEMAVNRALFPDSPYRYVSGGDPASIPDLSYDEFISSHRKFYSPSNSYIILDGNVDIEKTLEIIDAEYLANMEKGERIAPPALQPSVDGGDTEIEYELGEEESLENRTRITWGSVLGTFDEKEKIVAMKVLADVLCGSNQSLLSKTVLSQGLAEDISMQVYDGVYQPWLKIEARNIADGRANELEELIFSELKTLAENGIDHAQLEATMANFEFQMRERDYGNMPQGIIFGIIMLETWLYGGDPINNLAVGDLFNSLKEKMKNGYFESLINDLILNNTHKAKVTLVPSYTAGDNRREKEQARIDSEVSLWNDEIKAEEMNKQKKLMSWQNTQDSPEALATLPSLKLSDISSKPENLPIEISKRNEITTLYHDINCSGIANFALFFDADDLTQDEISELSFLTDILGKIRTENKSEEELDRLSRLLFGNISFSVSSYAEKSCTDSCKIKLAVVFGTLEQNIKEALGLVAEILTETQFDKEETAFDLVKQLSTDYYQRIVMGGASIGMGRISAQNTAVGVANECAGGFEYYKWLTNNSKNWNWAELKAKLESLVNRIICSDRLTLSLTGASREALISTAEYFEDKLREANDSSELKSVIKPWGKRNEGIAVPADISFACAGGLLPDFTEYNGTMSVASNIISLQYLWNVIRVQGGAYGTGFSIRRNGLANCYSYRDPNAANSLNCYKGIAEFLRNFCEKTEDISGYIIGAVSSASPLLTPKMKGAKADDNYWSQISYEDREKMFSQMLASTAESIMSVADSIEIVFNDSGICVIGGRKQLENCQIDKIETL